MSLREVEERGGPNKDTMSLAERGRHRPNAQTLGKIAQAFDMSVADLRAHLERRAPTLEMSDERFEQVVREASDDALGALMDELGPHLPRRSQGERPPRTALVALHRCIAIARERKARAAAEVEELEQLKALTA